MAFQPVPDVARFGFSALQRAEIAEIVHRNPLFLLELSFSALQRAEIAEIYKIAEIERWLGVSVLFNEPKLLKSR